MNSGVWDGARRRIHICEVGTRDGLQIEAAFVPAEFEQIRARALARDASLLRSSAGTRR